MNPKTKKDIKHTEVNKILPQKAPKLVDLLIRKSLEMNPKTKKTKKAIDNIRYAHLNPDPLTSYEEIYFTREEAVSEKKRIRCNCRIIKVKVIPIK